MNKVLLMGSGGRGTCICSNFPLLLRSSPLNTALSETQKHIQNMETQAPIHIAVVQDTTHSDNTQDATGTVSNKLLYDITLLPQRSPRPAAQR